jgi:hypothetical protein
METKITGSHRSATLRTVYVTLVNVAPPGQPWTPGHGGRQIELTSFQGGPVEVYERTSDGLYRSRGSLKDYLPSGGSTLEALRAAWLSEQPSRAARTAFETSEQNREIRS